MNYLSVENLSLSYGERVIFKDITFGLNKGEKIALIAENGSGKSSILRIICKLMEADSGKVSWRNSLRRAYLDQEPELDATLSIRDYIGRANTEVTDAIQQYEQALKLQQDKVNRQHMEDLASASARMDELNAWDYERRLTELLNRFQIGDLNRIISKLSGGERKRLALAVCLLENPDFLVLDEPTNHLDVDMIEWLEEYLSKSAITLLMVTHDRYFLDRVCNGILELYEGRFYKHPGEYERFLQNKAERLENMQVEHQKDLKHLRSELEWVKRSPKARTGKRKSRLNAYNDLQEKVQGVSKTTTFDFQVKPERIGSKILEIKRLSKGYGEKLLISDFSYTFKKGERIGIAGPNGSGKSTLLKLIMEEEIPDSGRLIRGDTIKFGYYKQETTHLDPDKRVIDLVRDVAEVIELADGGSLSASLFLQKFDFSAHKQYTAVGNLSGGERRRLHLIMVLMSNPNFLILDEPTNDLDLLTLNKLEAFLLAFPGPILLVSHDRYFMDRIADHLFVFDGTGQIRDYNGSYSEYREQLLNQSMASPRERTIEPTTEKTNNRKRKLSFREREEWKHLENDIPQLQQKIESLELELQNTGIDFTLLQEKSALLQKLIEELDRKEMRWLELSEIEEE